MARIGLRMMPPFPWSPLEFRTVADALSPHGSNATLASVGTFSEGFERFVTSPLYLVGYVRWDARSDQSSFVKQSLQQLSGRNAG